MSTANSSLYLSSCLFIGLSALVAPPAHACSPVRCQAPWVFPKGGEVPVDQLTLLYQQAYDGGRAMTDPSAALRLVQGAGMARKALAFDLSPGPIKGAFNVRLREALPVGTTIAVEVDGPSCAPNRAIRTQITLAEPIAIPPALGTLTVTTSRAAMPVGTSAGSCFVDVDAGYADLHLNPAPGVAALDNVLRYELVVDGKEVVRREGTGDSRLADSGRSALVEDARVFAVCRRPGERAVRTPPVAASPGVPTAGAPPGAEYNALSLGKHRAKLVGRLPNGTVLETEEVTFTLGCDGPEPPAGWDKRPEWSER